jgi:hypothetical protein
MSDRLTELQRQRALAQEQLAWFDREIARESAKVNPIISVKPVAPPIPPPPVATEADELLKRYQPTGSNIHGEVKRGCFIYFFSALVLLALGIAAFYLIWRR